MDLAFTDRSIRQVSKLGNFVKKWIRRPGSAPDLVSGQQEKNGWVTFDFYIIWMSIMMMMMILCWQDGDDDVGLIAI